MGQAEQMAERYGNNGRQWSDDAGVHLTDSMIEAGARCLDRENARAGRAARWQFPDGSVITTAGDAWDLGYAGCLCWQGVGHDGRCTE